MSISQSIYTLTQIVVMIFRLCAQPDINSESNSEPIPSILAMHSFDMNHKSDDKKRAAAL